MTLCVGTKRDQGTAQTKDHTRRLIPDAIVFEEARRVTRFEGHLEFTLQEPAINGLSENDRSLIPQWVVIFAGNTAINIKRWHRTVGVGALVAFNVSVLLTV